ncbi:hypothetical protein HDU76_007693, partial [Blyttiomyces sp. JEL0837]
LFSFLHDAREDVRQLAVSNIAGLTKAPEMLPFFLKNDGKVIKDIMAMKKDHPLIAHDSITALVNLSSYESTLPFMDDEGFISSLILTIVLPKSVLADLCCMLLNNMTKHIPIAKRLIPTSEPESTEPTTTTTQTSTTQPVKKRRTPHLDNLLEVFVRGESKQFNKDAQYHFLAGVFANIARVGSGAICLRSRSEVDGIIRLSKVLPFTEHKDLIRRGGCIATIKNCCFDVEDPKAGGLLLSEELNLLPYILLPLCGSEDFTDEEMEGMPDELQLMEPDKSREPDSHLRLILIETLLLLTSSRPGRELLRTKRAYPVIRNMHRAEHDEVVMERAERLVNMLMRDEEGEEEAEKEKGKPLKKKAAVIEVLDSDDEEESKGEEDAGAIDALI